jgi:DHA2 family methylenomycin A resistance protein-like MFS transporter
MRGATSRHSASRALTLAALSLGFAVVQLDVTIVNVAIHSIGESFGGQVSAMQWVVNSYTLAFAAFILSAGAAGDRFGAKRMFIAGFTIFTGASLGCALAPSLAWLIVSRTVQGIAAAILVPNSLALLNHTYTDSGRGRAVAIWAAGASLALTAGPLVGGLLITAIGWRSIFLVNLPVGAVGVWLTWQFAKETPSQRRREIDVPGQLLAAAALGLLAGGLIEGGANRWTNPYVLAALCVAAALIGGFIAVERRRSQPMLPLQLFRSHAFSATTAAGLLVNTAFYGLMFTFSLYFQQAAKLSPLGAGLAFIPMTGGCLLTNLAAPRVAARLGARWAILIGVAAMLAGCAAMLGINEHTRFVALIGPLLLLGGGLGLVVPPLTSVLLGSVDKERSGIAAGVLNASRQTGSVLGVAFMGSLLSGAGGAAGGTQQSLVVATGLLACAGAIVLIGLRWR